MSAKDSFYQSVSTLFGMRHQSFTVQDCVELLHLKRTLINHYLNRLCEDGLLNKTKSRPVRFTIVTEASVHDAETHLTLPSGEAPCVFDEFIGARGSLSEAIAQCMAAVRYPDGGLPVLICGDSGVGKSYLATLIHRFARDEAIIRTDAPLVVLNCADYANNPELLSATLFGYTRGAFTGADREKEGLLDKADGGFLFLDEVHRLSPENQEKLFMLMDKGSFCRLGDNNRTFTAQVRFIFATTESITDVLLATLLRRIPFIINLPDFSARPLTEKLALIRCFFQREARRLKTDLRIDIQMLDELVHFRDKGNIGGLKNRIKVKTASAYARYRHTSEILFVGDDISHDAAPSPGMVVRQDPAWADTRPPDGLLQPHGKRTTILQEFCISGNIVVFHRKLESMLFELYGGQYEDDLLRHWLWHKFNQIVNLFEQNTGLMLEADTSKLLYYCLLYGLRTPSGLDQDAQLVPLMEERPDKAKLLASELLSLINNALTDASRLGLFPLFVSVFSALVERQDTVQGVIICHGYRTASSIAATANHLLSGYYFKSFDMSNSVSTQAIIDRLLSFIDAIKSETGLIILVDMGSLQEIYKEIKLRLNGDLLVINNVSTGMALDIGSKIQSGLPVREIAQDIAHLYKVEARYYHGIVSGSKIIISCISGEGISKKLKDIFDRHISNEKIEIVTMEYDDLKWKLTHTADALNGTKLIVTTTELDCGYIPQVNVQKLLREKKDTLLNRYFSGILTDLSLQQMLDEIVKLYTMEGVGARLNFLNPQVIINEVEAVIQAYEAWFDIHLESYPRMNIFMHIALMVERLMVGAGATRRDGQTLSAEQQAFVDLQPKFFDQLISKYHIGLTLTESLMLFEIMEPWLAPAPTSAV